MLQPRLPCVSLTKRSLCISSSQHFRVLFSRAGALPLLKTLERYLDRILKYSSCSNECFVLGLIYMDRFIQQNDFALTALNVHRVAITSVMVAAKFFDDQYYNNAYYAKVWSLVR